MFVFPCDDRGICALSLDQDPASSGVLWRSLIQIRRAMFSAFTLPGALDDFDKPPPAAAGGAAAEVGDASGEVGGAVSGAGGGTAQGEVSIVRAVEYKEDDDMVVSETRLSNGTAQGGSQMEEGMVSRKIQRRAE